MFLLRRKIPITISPFFWVTAALIGYLNVSSMGGSYSLLFGLIWVFVIFTSILVHELGHALTALYFGQQPRIELVAFGGLTYSGGKPLRGWREFLVVLFGPLFGVLLFFLASTLLVSGFFTGMYVVYTLRIFVVVNLFWTLLNLIPVIPLDGGQLLRIICESICGVKGVKYAIVSSIVLALAASLWLFLKGFFIPGMIFSIFAFQNFNSWRQARLLTTQDRDEGLTTEMKEIESLLLQGGGEGISSRLEEIRKKTKQGLLFNMSSEQLAHLKAKGNDYQAVYALLAPIHKDISPEAELLLHHGAYAMADYLLVVALAGRCFRNRPGAAIAVRSAESCAALKQVESTIGWLKAARKEEVLDLPSIIARPIFDSVRETPAFHAFLKTM